MSEWPWITSSQAASLIGVEKSQFASIRSRMPAEAVKGSTRNLRFNAVELVRVWAAVKQRPTEDSELERGRAIENDHKRLRLMKEVGKVVEVASIRPGLMLLANALKDTGARLTKRYGNDAGDMLNEGIKAGEREIQGYFDRLEAEREASAVGDDDGERVIPPANDAAVRRR